MGRNRFRFRRREDNTGGRLVGAILDGINSHIGHGGSRDQPHFRRGSHLPDYGFEYWDPGDALPDDDDEDDVDDAANTPLRVTGVEFHLGDNRRNHHSERFEDAGLLVRRGQPFVMTVFTNRKMDYPNEKMHFRFAAGSHPKQSKGTLAIAKDGDNLKTRDWACKLVTQSDNENVFHVITAKDSIIGRYSISIVLVTTHDGDPVWKKHKLSDKMTLLFNPWWHEDQVYLDGEAERQEYVLSDTGRIYIGSERRIRDRPWVFGQFESVALDAAFSLLMKSDLDSSAHGNPVLVCRALSAMTNSNDDSGVIAGRWDGNYSRGTPPTAWTGSPEILELFIKRNKPVKYGQCWVFSGVLTTLCRAIGLPTRSVTNYSSAHDKDYSMTIDYHRDENGRPLPRYDDSIWNFHVWNESWFTRPDLPQGYGGWQAFDSTPQEASEGRMQCGPAPVSAVRDGLVYLGYDAKFVFAEVNGDIVYWIMDRYGTMNPIHSNHHHVGKLISTKAVGVNARYDITREYKHPEGTTEERRAMEKAAEFSSRRDRLEDHYDNTDNDDVTFDFDGDMTPSGDIRAKLKVATPREEEGKEVEVHMYARAKYYTGVAGEALEDYHVMLDLSTKKEASTTWTLDAANILSRLNEDASVAIYIMGRVKVKGQFTGQVYVNTETFVIDKPELNIQVGESLPRVNVPFELRVSFENPLSVPLTNCSLHLDGPGIQRTSPTQIRGSVGPGVKFIEYIRLVPRLAGNREIVGCFHSRQLTDVTGVVQVNVTD